MLKPGQRPVPGGGRPKPKPRMTKQSLPKVKALYEYQARDVDELSFDVNDILELVKEGCIKKLRTRFHFFNKFFIFSR